MLLIPLLENVPNTYIIAAISIVIIQALTYIGTLRYQNIMLSQHYKSFSEHSNYLLNQLAENTLYHAPQKVQIAIMVQSLRRDTSWFCAIPYNLKLGKVDAKLLHTQSSWLDLVKEEYAVPRTINVNESTLKLILNKHPNAHINCFTDVEMIVVAPIYSSNDKLELAGIMVIYLEEDIDQIKHEKIMTNVAYICTLYQSILCYDDVLKASI